MSREIESSHILSASLLIYTIQYQLGKVKESLRYFACFVDRFVYHYTVLLTLHPETLARRKFGAYGCAKLNKLSNLIELFQVVQLASCFADRYVLSIGCIDSNPVTIL